MKWKQHKKQILLIVWTIIFLFSLISFINSSFYPGTKTYKTNTQWRSTDLSKGTGFRGLNTTYVLKQDYAFQNISYNGFSFVAMKDNTAYWLNTTSGSNQIVNVYQWFTSSSTVLEYTVTGTYINKLYVGNLGAPTVTGADLSSYDAVTKTVQFTTTPSSSQIVYFTWSSYAFIFHGVFNETTGIKISGDAQVTAYFTDGTIPSTFTVDGTYSYSTTNTLQYFRMVLPSGAIREYWVGEETTGEIWLFDEADFIISQSGLNYFVYNQSTYYDVIFGTLEPNANYNANVSLTWSSTYTISAKTTSGFRVTFGTVPNQVANYLSWYVYRYTQKFIPYTIQFLDLANLLEANPYITAEYYVNGTRYVVERRKADVDRKVQFQLLNGRKYTIALRDGTNYVFGELQMTSVTTITLTLKGIDFPKETLLTYKYVRIYSYRMFDTPNGNITVLYQDTLAMTTSVKLDLYYKNDTLVATTTELTDSFTYIFSSIANDTDYKLTATITHERYGVYEWKQYYPRAFSVAPWGLGWLGNLGINTSILLPIFLILASAGLFSQINAEVGAFMACVVAALLTYMGWISIAPGFLITAFFLAISMGIIYSKRRVQT